MDCGRLVMGGFDGTVLPDAYARALGAGRRGGAILFKRNLDGSPAGARSLARALHAAAPGAKTLVGIDQEGGRVARLGPPLLRVPPMRALGGLGDADLAERVALAVGAELAALGVNLVFAPVLDVDTRADNPVIGDRSFGADPALCARLGVAWIRGLQAAGVLACGKHYPGHGDTSQDSHVDLPVVDQPIERLEQVELAPFRAAARAGVATLMSAHVVYPALDRLPATLSRPVSTTLREKIGFRGVLVSDDLEMRAISARWSIEDAAVMAIGAGCDLLLVCWSDDLQERAIEALTREAERSPAFRGRCEQALLRCASALEGASGPGAEGAFDVQRAGPSHAVAAELVQRLA